MDNQFTLKKRERISSRKEIDQLFKEGVGFIAFPLRVIYSEKKSLSGAAVSILISVPKKKFKHAVKRNRIKRLIREAYRLNKNALIPCCIEKECGLLIAFLFIGNEMSQWNEINTAVRKALEIVKERVE